ncbi:MAG: MDR family oxidoreductase [Roseiflexaceae bacterium]|nr:MDR family oxidoreductase [Roseiflexaceae bacterium]
MLPETYTALLVDQREGATVAEIRTLTPADLPPGDVIVRVAYSSLNYKDGLAVTGTGKIIRSFPLVPGIDLAGTVIESGSPAYKPGDAVILTGWGIGERYWGGYTQLTRVKSEWLVPLPNGLSQLHSMAIGTAGLTAMLCVMALEEAGIVLNNREVLVTGAAGGVGSVAVALLAKAGFSVVAATGRPETHDYLRMLGAARVVDRAEIAAPGRALEGETWAAAIDTVGGDTLAGIIRALAYNGAVAACGNAGGVQLNTTVFPFILRGTKLLGVESVLCPFNRRQVAWARLAQDLTPELLDSLVQVVSLANVPEVSRQIVAGQIRGRVVVDVNT